MVLIDEFLGEIFHVDPTVGTGGIPNHGYLRAIDTKPVHQLVFVHFST